jgi:hypothetical protein
MEWFIRGMVVGMVSDCRHSAQDVTFCIKCGLSCRGGCGFGCGLKRINCEINPACGIKGFQADHLTDDLVRVVRVVAPFCGPCVRAGWCRVQVSPIMLMRLLRTIAKVRLPTNGRFRDT